MTLVSVKRCVLLLQTAALLLLIVATLSGCGQKVGAASSANASGTVAPVLAAATTGAPLSISLATAYDGYTTLYQPSFLETGTPICATSTTSPSVTCTVQIPEARLFYSSVQFQVSWYNTTGYCRLMAFAPYMYQVSNVANTIVPWSTSAIDCSAVPLVAGCFGGAAPGLVPNFPTNTGILEVPDESNLGTQSRTYTLPSAWSTLNGSNRKTANDYPSAKWNTGISAGAIVPGVPGAPDQATTSEPYLAGTYRNYTWSCRDDYDDPTGYQITLYVQDIDSQTSAGSQDQIATWKEAP